MVVKKVFSSATVALTSLSLAFAPTPPAAPPRYDAPPTGNLSVQERPLTEPLAPLGVAEAPEPEPLGPQPSPAPPLTPQQEQAVLAATGEANAAQRAAQRAEEEAAQRAEEEAAQRAEEEAAQRAEEEAAQRAEEEAAAEIEAQRQAEEEAAAEIEAQRQAEVETSSSHSPHSVWDRLAECESNGEWDYGPHSNWGNHIFHGGVQFLPSTWDWIAPMVGLGHIDVAYQATRGEQILAAEKLLELQGWVAWPVCSRKLGLR